MKFTLLRISFSFVISIWIWWNIFFDCVWSITHLKYNSVKNIKTISKTNSRYEFFLAHYKIPANNEPVHNSKLIGAIDGQITFWFGSYIGFNNDFNTSGRFKYDQRLVVLVCSLIISRSRSESPKNVPYELKKLCSNSSINICVLNSKLNGNWQCSWYTASRNRTNVEAAVFGRFCDGV